MVTSKTTLKTCFLLWVIAAGLSSAASSSFQDEKNFYTYYTPYINAGPPPPVVSYQNPSPDHAVYYQNPPPDHANEPPAAVPSPPSDQANNPPPVSYQNPPPVQQNNPPAGSITPPFHHHHHHHHPIPKPPTNCDIPPSGGYGNPNPPPPTDSHIQPPSGGGGGGGSSPPSDTIPPTPSEQPVQQPPPPTVYQAPPPKSGGCICGQPPNAAPAGPVIEPAPSPVEDHNPSPLPPRQGYHYYPPPSTTTPPSSAPENNNPPAISPVADIPSASPPSPPTKPTTPKAKTSPVTGGYTFPSPPSFPNIPFLGGTCDFWRKHPNMLSDLFNWWRSTFGRSMGLGNIIPGPNMNFLKALSNQRTDGIGALYREGTASLLNSMVNKNFPFTTSHVIESFMAALVSSEVAAAQAKVFKLANEGRLKPRV